MGLKNRRSSGVTAAMRHYRMLLHTHVCFTTCDALRSPNAKLELTAKPLFRRVVAALYHAVRRGYRRNGQPVPGRILHPPGAPTTHLAPAQSSSVDLAVKTNSSAAVVLANSISPTAFAKISMTTASRLLTRVQPSRRAREKSSLETASFFFHSNALVESTIRRALHTHISS